MGKSIRIPLAEPLTNRDSTATKDSKLTNCFMQNVSGQPLVIKRPGTLSAIQNTAGQGQGVYCYNGYNYAVNSQGPYSGNLFKNGNFPVASSPSTTGLVSTQTNPDYVFKIGNYVYVCNNGSDSLQIFYTNDPGNPVLISTTSVITPKSVFVVGNYAYVVGNSSNRLSIFSVSDPSNLVLVGSISTGGQPYSIFVSGNYAYVATNSTGKLEIYDVSTVSSPVFSGSILAGTNPTSVYVVGVFAYVVNSGNNLLQIFNISSPTAITLVGSLGIGGSPQQVIVSNNYAYVVNAGGSSLQIINVSTPASPTLSSTTATGSTPYGLSVLGNYAYVVTTVGNTLQCFDITSPTAPSLLFTFSVGNGPQGIVSSGIYTYLTNTTDKTLQVVHTATLQQSSIAYPISNTQAPYNFSSVGQASTALLVLKNSDAMYTFNPETGVLQRVTSVNYPSSTVPGLVYSDGTFYVATSDAKIYGSAIEDPTTWSALNYISAEIEPDGLVAIEKSLNYLVAFGQWTTEFFYDAGNATGSPLSSVPNAFFTVGCASGTSVVRMENEVVWMSQTIQRGRQIMSLSGFTPSIISTPEVDRILNADDLATVYAFSMKISGSVFYIITLKTSAKTLVYDFSTKQWHFWTSMTPQAAKSVTTITSTSGIATVSQTSHGYADGDLITIAGATPTAYNGSFNITYVDANTYTYPVPLGTTSPATGTITSVGYTEGYFNAVAYSFCSGSDLIQGETDGKIYKIDPSYYDDNGNYINTKIKTIRIDGGESKRKFVSKAEIIGDKVGATGLLRYSDDDYTTWSVYRPVDLSAKRSLLLRGGHTRRRAYEFRCTASVPLRIEALELDVEPGTS